MKKIIASITVAAAMVATAPAAQAQPLAPQNTIPAEYADLLGKIVGQALGTAIIDSGSGGSGGSLKPGRIGLLGSTLGVICSVSGSVLSMASVDNSTAVVCSPLQGAIGPL